MAKTKLIPVLGPPAGLSLESRVDGDKVIYKATIRYPKGFAAREADVLDRLLLQGMIDKHGRG